MTPCHLEEGGGNRRTVVETQTSKGMLMIKGAVVLCAGERGESAFSESAFSEGKSWRPAEGASPAESGAATKRHSCQYLLLLPLPPPLAPPHTDTHTWRKWNGHQWNLLLPHEVFNILAD